MDISSNLTGKLLIAMPGMLDPRFERSVILICAHSSDGAMGLVVNRAMAEIQFPQLLEQLGIELGQDMRDIPVRFGGPVEPGRGFVLHRAEPEGGDPEGGDAEGADPEGADPEGMVRIDDELVMTTTRNILEDFAAGLGPDPAVLALGYAGWGPGQLDNEILQNGWLTSERSDEIIFGTDNDAKWLLALRDMGIDPLLLSPSAGHA